MTRIPLCDVESHRLNIFLPIFVLSVPKMLSSLSSNSCIQVALSVILVCRWRTHEMPLTLLTYLGIFGIKSCG